MSFSSIDFSAPEHEQSLNLSDPDQTRKVNLSVMQNFPNDLLETSFSCKSSKELDEKVQATFKEAFRKWILDTKAKITHVQPLLRILQPLCPTIPSTYATLLNTKDLERPEITKFDDNGFKYVYFGIVRQLRKILIDDLHQDGEKLKMQLNVDGLPLFRSSKIEFWPILAHILEPSVYKPFIVAIYCGKGKPSNIGLFLKDLIAEFNLIITRGVEINEKKFTIKFMGFACDIPARTFLKCTKGHSGFYSCERCNIKGLN